MIATKTLRFLGFRTCIHLSNKPYRNNNPPLQQHNHPLQHMITWGSGFFSMSRMILTFPTEEEVTAGICSRFGVIAANPSPFKHTNRRVPSLHFYTYYTIKYATHLSHLVPLLIHRPELPSIDEHPEGSHGQLRSPPSPPLPPMP